LPQYRGRLCNNALDDLGRARDIADEIDVLAGPHGATRNIVACRRQIFLLDIRLSCRQLVLAAVPLGRECVLERAAWIDRPPGRAADNVEHAGLHRLVAPAFSAAAFIDESHSDSHEAVKRVPIEMPVAPSASVAARPRPSAMPPPATTGIGATTSTTAGTSPIVPRIVPE